MLLMVLNIVLSVGLVAFLLTLCIFMKNLRPKVPDFTCYIMPSGLFIIFIGLIDKCNYWRRWLLSQIAYTWGDIRESIDHKIPKFVSPLPPVTPPQTKTFKPSHRSFAKAHSSYTHKSKNGIRSYLILVSILLSLCPTQIKMDCSSRFTFRNHNCILTYSSQPKCWGDGADGQLGYGDTSIRGDSANEMSDYLPFVNVNSSVQSIHVGFYHNCVHLSPSFDVKCLGYNLYGQLGYGDTQDRGDGSNEMGSYLSTINFGPGVFVSEISSGGFHNLILTDSGQVKAWGRNSLGQLGYGDLSNRGFTVNQMGNYLPFVQLGSGRTAISSRNQVSSSCVTLDDLSVKCWGRNNVGQCGQGNSSDIGDAPNEMGNYLPPINFPSVVVVSSLGTGWDHVGIISSTGSLFTWGWNNNGQLGLGHSSNIGDGGSEMGEYLQAVKVGSGRSVVQFQGGQFHSCVILDNFNVKCFGLNDQGQLGYGDTSTRGSLANQMGNYLPEVNLGSGFTAQSLHIGRRHSCVVLNDNSFKCFGDNFVGQLGIGSTDDQGDDPNEMGGYLKPINLGTGVEIEECFDYSPTSSPTFDPSFQPTFDPTFIPPTLNPTINSSLNSTYNPSFQPSFHPTYDPTFQPTFDPTFIPPLNTLTCSSKFSFGFFNCIFTNSGNQIKCWGDDNFGQLGLGNTTNRGDEPNEMSDYLPFVNLPSNVISIHGGRYHACGQTSTLQVNCWGQNNNGQLGYGDSSSRGDNANEMGDYLPFVNLGSDVLVGQLSLGNSNSFMIDMNSGLIKGWGSNTNGALGYEDTSHRGNQVNEMGNYLPFINMEVGRLPLVLRTGDGSNCIIQDDLTKKCWGRNSFGQLGYGDISNRGDSTNEMGDYLMAINLPVGDASTFLSGGHFHFGIISVSGNLYLWGYNSDGQIGIGSVANIGNDPNEMGTYLQKAKLGSGRTAIEFQGGQRHTCVILDNLTLKCFGNNVGQLGYGDINDRGDDPNEMGNYLSIVNLGLGRFPASLHIGSAHSCIVLDDDSMKCFGTNVDGQLGQGHSLPLGNSPNEMGDYLPPIKIGTGVEVRLCEDFSPTVDPTFYPTFDPSFNPTFDPTFIPPTLNPTINSSLNSTYDPSIQPSFDPTFIPPTLNPTINSSLNSTYDPSFQPTFHPTLNSSLNSTYDPTFQPTFDPTFIPPTLNPTINSSLNSTYDPTFQPTFDPTFIPPTLNPTINSTNTTYDPTFQPTFDPTFIPPTLNPTVNSSLNSTYDPTFQPTFHPTVNSSLNSTYDPTFQPTFDPTFIPPTLNPTVNSSLNSTYDPTFQPTFDPTFIPPTLNPTVNSSLNSTYDPTFQPTFDPTFIPPTLNPTINSSLNSTYDPTFQPTPFPTPSPTTSTPIPTPFPTPSPTTSTPIPTPLPTNSPTTPSPTFRPTLDPTFNPTLLPQKIGFLMLQTQFQTKRCWKGQTSSL